MSDEKTKPTTELQPGDLGAALQKFEDAMKKTLRLGLTREAVHVLIAHDTGISVPTIKKILDSATNLSRWTTPK